ncbi:MAG: nucleotidyltransferase family protein [Candidatus Omnitrophica bacterium]|nr:nucleotidyltransferase family protein [Candidatus Omnitrophota bacterium]
MVKVTNFEGSLSSEEKLVLETARWVLDNQGSRLPGLLSCEKLDWHYYWNLLDFHELYPFANICLGKDGGDVPSDTKEFLQTRSRANAIYQFYVWNEFIRIAKIFLEKDLDFIALKGIAFMAMGLYGDYAWERPMIDMDILVRQEQLARFTDTLEGLGYRKHLMGLRESYWRNRGYHLAFVRQEPGTVPSMIELHWAFDVKRKNRILPFLWERVHRETKEGIPIATLSAEDTLFSLALNQRHYGRTLCLKHALDASLLLKKYRSILDWGYIAKESSSSGLRAALFYLLSFVRMICDEYIPGQTDEDLKPSAFKKYAIRRFIQKNTFGRKNERANKEAYLRSLFFLFDSLSEPVWYMLNVPQEKFAMFYGLDPYEKKTKILYQSRLVYGLLEKFRNDTKTS